MENWLLWCYVQSASIYITHLTPPFCSSSSCNLSSLEHSARLVTWDIPIRSRGLHHPLIKMKQDTNRLVHLPWKLCLSTKISIWYRSDSSPPEAMASFNTVSATFLLDEKIRAQTQCISNRLSISLEQKNIHRVHWSWLSKVNFWGFYLGGKE